jgi:hypothetical protein
MMTKLLKALPKFGRVFGGGTEPESDHDARMAARLDAMTRSMANSQPVRRLF